MASKKKGGRPAKKRGGAPKKRSGRRPKKKAAKRWNAKHSSTRRPKKQGTRVRSASGGAVRKGKASGKGKTAAKAGLWDQVLEQADAARETERGLVRLNAYLARCGVASRRACDDLILTGRVFVNDESCTQLGTKIDPLRDSVEIDGEELRPEKPVYVLLHKPKGVVCTNAKREQKTRALDLVSHIKGRLFPVGRLDLDSEGLLLLTNDGSFAERMMHPRYGVPKTYKVTLRGRIELDEVEKAKGGVWLAEGRTGGVRIRLRRRTKERSYLEVTIREGRNREIRRIFARFGYPVLRLTRTRIAGIDIRGLKSGDSRFLSPSEVRELIDAASPETEDPSHA